MNLIIFNRRKHDGFIKIRDYYNHYVSVKMSNGDLNKFRHKQPNFLTQSTAHAEISTSGIVKDLEINSTASLCPLLAKDSEWVDILQSNMISTSVPNVKETEELECEDGPDTKTLTMMFPALLERSPDTLEGILNKTLSTTEVTKHLVDLRQKANFTFMKKVHRLIPKDKKWLESLLENSDSHCSTESESQFNMPTLSEDSSNENVNNDKNFR